jgi:hypothetical protein
MLRRHPLRVLALVLVLLVALAGVYRHPLVLVIEASFFEPWQSACVWGLGLVEDGYLRVERQTYCSIVLYGLVADAEAALHPGSN